MENMKPPAFISYARSDGNYALRLASDLKKSGANVWLDQLDIGPGRIWDVEIEKALAACEEMILILTPASVSSRNVMDEVSFALKEGKTVMPLLFQDSKIPYRIDRLERIDFRSAYDEGLSRLRSALGAQAQVANAVIRVRPADLKYNTIMAGVQAADEGDRVLIEEGRYEESVVLHKPVEIAGVGDREKVVLECAYDNCILFDAAQGRISNLTIRYTGNGEHSAVKITKGRLLLEGCDITSRGLSCVSIQNDAVPTVRGNRIHGGHQEGIYAGEGATGVIEGNEIFENEFAGVAVWRGAAPTIRDNEIYDCKEGIYIGDEGRGTIDKNRLHHNRGPGIKVAGGEPTILSNQEYKNGAAG
jgi:parallel beta-helix repeat protein